MLHTLSSLHALAAQFTPRRLFIALSILSQTQDYSSSCVLHVAHLACGLLDIVAVTQSFTCAPSSQDLALRAFASLLCSARRASKASSCLYGGLCHPSHLSSSLLFHHGPPATAIRSSSTTKSTTATIQHVHPWHATTASSSAPTTRRSILAPRPFLIQSQRQQRPPSATSAI